MKKVVISTLHNIVDGVHSTLNTQHSTLNTQHSTLNTQHSTRIIVKFLNKEKNRRGISV